MSEVPKKPLRGLGRGLDALLPVRNLPSTPTRPAVDYGQGNVFSCALERIVPQKGQPRQHFAADVLLHRTPFQRLVDQHKISARRRVEGPQLDRRSDVTARELQVPALVVDDPQHVAGIEISRLGGDH